MKLYPAEYYGFPLTFRIELRSVRGKPTKQQTFILQYRSMDENGRDQIQYEFQPHRISADWPALEANLAKFEQNFFGPKTLPSGWIF